ncbi:MAG: hypothetical protein LBI17_01715 [Rickettsiales bacterium]|jgi:cell shape-determining protein MreD|nr:hypothetical protein [Rickettsiales bacterium]
MPRFRKYRVLTAFLAKGTPFIECFLIQVLSFSPLMPFQSKPVLVLVPIFFWAMAKTAYIDFIPIMLLGFVQDFMDGTVIGLNVFVFLSLYFMVYYQKIFPIDASFGFSYMAFAAVSFALAVAKYSIVSLFVPLVGVLDGLVNWALLALFFPPIYMVLRYSNDRMVSRYQ